MKNWILSHKILSIVLACAIGVGAICAVVLPIALRHKHEFSAEWSYDDTDHFHKCLDENCKTVSDKAAHVFDKEVVADKYIVAKATYTEAAKYYKSCLCGAKGTEIFNSGSSLSAKDNVINLKEGVTLGKTYDGEAYTLTAEEITRKGEGAITFMYKLKDSEAEYTETAPKKAGEYTVKVTVAATPEWKETAKTFDYAINPKPLNATANKVYDGNTNIEVTLGGVVSGDIVTATATITSKNVGATVKEITLAGEDKDNYEIDKTMVSVSITPIVITVEWGKEYDNSNIFTGEPTELLEGDEVTITVTMDSANVGASVQSVALTGKDAGNYSLDKKDVTAEIDKADIDFSISNAEAFAEGFFVGATNIPDPVTNYKEIGTGYGENTIVWEKQIEGGVWSRTLTKEEVKNLKSGAYRVRIQYNEGENYNFGATPYVKFTVKVKERTLNVTNFDGKTYDGAPVANFNYDALEDTVEITDLPGVNDLTSPYVGEKYVEYRRKGEEIYTTVTGTYIPKNAAEYEYRIGIKATEEWAATVSEVKTFTIAQVEIKLEKGYIATSGILQNGDLLYLATHTPVAGETVALRLVNGKAGLELTAPGSGYVKQGQKKQVSVQNNLDCFRLTSTLNANVSNYKIVKSAGQKSVEITVVPSGNGTANQITGKSESIDAANNKKLSMWTTVNTGSFQVGQTVIVSDKTGTKLFEAKIVRVGVVDPDGDGSYNTTSQSGCVIPSDGKVCIQVDTTGLTYDVNKVKGGSIRVK